MEPARRLLVLSEGRLVRRFVTRRRRHAARVQPRRRRPGRLASVLARTRASAARAAQLPSASSRSLLRRAERADSAIAERVRRAAPALAGAWPVATVVHRDLYEDQIILG